MLSILKTNKSIILCMLIIWLLIVEYNDLWWSFRENWLIAVIMTLGAFIAGASSEGGGAVAFPALTLLYGLSPQIGSSFALTIQSFGMTSASYYIVKTKVRVSWKLIKIALPFSFVGFVISKQWITSRFEPEFVKIYFVSFWLSFGLVLILKNKIRKSVLDDIDFKSKLDYVVVAIFGCLGGAISAIVGSGIDILVFSTAVLWFNLSEKVATPTSVILMAGVSLFSVLYQIASEPYFQPKVLELLVVAIPVVIIVAPLGAKFISSQTRKLVIAALAAILVVQYIGAFLVLDTTAQHFMFSLLVLISGSLIFSLMLYVRFIRCRPSKNKN